MSWKLTWQQFRQSSSAKLASFVPKLEQEADVDSGSGWSGQLLVDAEQVDLLETARAYRLELDDGRAGQVVVARVEMLPGQRRIKIIYRGTSPLLATETSAASS